MHRVAALQEHPRALAPRGTRPDDEHRVIGAFLRELLRMPAAPVLLPGGGILRADHRRSADLPARNAHVAADAHPNVIVAPLLDLLRQPGIGDRGARRTDDIRYPLGDDLGHLLRIGKPSHPQHRLLRHLLHEARPGHLVSLLVEARGARILAPLGDIPHIHVPQIHQRIRQPDELHPVALDLHPRIPIQRIDRKARRNRAVLPHRAAHLLQSLQPKARPILQRPAVLVLALVVVGG